MYNNFEEWFSSSGFNILERMINMSEEKMKSEELGNVAGGASGEKDIAQNKPDLSKLGIRTKTAKCKICGKEYQKVDEPISMIVTDEFLHYDGMCPECVKTHPYKKPIEKLIK